jgi:hypothetical protein
MVALAVLAGGCGKVLIFDMSVEKLAIASTYPGGRARHEASWPCGL